MNYYELVAGEQRWNNWLLFSEDEKEAKLDLKLRYKHLCCVKCGKFDHDAVFEEGFDANVNIRGRGDIIATDDGFHCINAKLKQIIVEEGFRGRGI